MELAQIFRKMRSEAESSDAITKPTKEVLKRRLLFFEQQCACDTDRRASDRDLRFAWKEIEVLKEKKRIFRWTEEREIKAGLCAFFGIPFNEPVKPKIESVKTSALKPFDIFRQLLYAVEGSVKSPIGKETSLIMRYGLMILKNSADLPKSKRDNLENRRIWKEIWPLLEQHGLLTAVRADERNKTTLEFFLKGEFG
jgi:hypothetical protein